MSVNEISVQELAALMQQSIPFFLLDVRTPEEYQAANIGGTLIPLQELPNRLQEIPQNMPIAVLCRSGHRSQLAQSLLQQAGFADVKNITGGILAWSGTVT